MEEKLEESEGRFRGLFEGIQDSVCIFVGSEGRLLDYNPAFKKIFGYRDEELKDKAYLDFVYPDDRAWFWKNITQNTRKRSFPSYTR